MNNLEFTVLVGLGSFMAGFLGALTGLGGGVVLVPLLALVFKVDIRYAVGASGFGAGRVCKVRTCAPKGEPLTFEAHQNSGERTRMKTQHMRQFSGRDAGQSLRFAPLIPRMAGSPA